MTRSLVVAVLSAGMLVVVPAVAQANGPPSLAWSPTTSGGTYDYAAVMVGHSDAQIFTLTNSGGSVSAVITIKLTGSPAFTTTADTCTATTLAPRQSCTVRVIFSPANSGTDTATLAAAGKRSAFRAVLSLAGTGIGDHIYWTNQYSGTINQANLAGTNPQVLVSGQSDPAGVAVDAHHVYWANFAPEGDTINEANLDGTNPHILVSGQNYPFGLAVDAHHIYWTNRSPGTINEANLDGTDPHILLNGLSYPLGVAVDAHHVYWSDDTSNTINEANVDGTNPRTLVSGLNYPAGVAVDAQHIFWTDSNAGVVSEANLDGTNPRTLVSNQYGADGLAVDAQHIYWADAVVPTPNTINEANLDGANPHILLSNQNGPTGVAVSG
jgi:Domain of unknown function (DUF5050)